MSSSEFEDLDGFEAYDSQDDMSEWEESHSSRPIRNYRLITMAEISQIQNQLICTVSDSLGVLPEVGNVLLNQFKWQDDALCSKFFDDGQFLEKQKLANFGNIKFTTCHLDECLICCEEARIGFHLGCGHAICDECFLEYTKMKIKEREIFSLKCPGDSTCNYVITDKVAQQLLDGYHWRLYLKNKAELYIATQRDRFVGCPAPDCTLYAEALNPMGKSNDENDKMHDSGTAYRDAVVECTCNSTFCFLCGESHLPVSCNLASTWFGLSKDASFMWIQSNTKACPKCQASVEKNGGCDHMSCRCGYHFCWACLGEFSGYRSHQCGRFDVSKEKATTESAIAGQRLLHYAPRIASNLASSKFHQHKMSEIREKEVINVDPLEEFHRPDFSEAGSLLEVHRALAESRSLIAWTMVLLFFIKKGNDRTLLDDCVINLQDSTELLGRIVSHKKLTATQAELASKSGYVKSRYSILLSHVLAKEWVLEPYMYNLSANSGHV